MLSYIVNKPEEMIGKKKGDRLSILGEEGTYTLAEKLPFPLDGVKVEIATGKNVKIYLITKKRIFEADGLDKTLKSYNLK